MAETVVTNQQSAPNWTGLRYLEDFTERYWPAIVNYSYNGSTFSVLACPKDTPQGNGLGQSDAGKTMKEMQDLSWGEWSDEKDIRMQGLEKQLAGLIGDACLPLMQELAPISIPEPRTLQERLYPPTYTLRVFAEDGGLASQELTNFEFPASIRRSPSLNYRKSAWTILSQSSMHLRLC